MTDDAPGSPRYEYTTTSTFSRPEKRQEKTKWLNLSLDRPLLCPHCNGHPREYQDGMAWTIRCCSVVTEVSREKALEVWNRRGGEYDPYHARCPNCGRVGFLVFDDQNDQMIPMEGSYDYRVVCDWCRGTVGIRVHRYPWIRRGGERMTSGFLPYGLKCAVCGERAEEDWTIYKGTVMHPRCIRKNRYGYKRSPPRYTYWGSYSDSDSYDDWNYWDMVHNNWWGGKE